MSEAGSASYEYYSDGDEPAPKEACDAPPPPPPEDDPQVDLPDAIPDEYYACSQQAAVEAFPETTCETPGCMMHVEDVIQYLVPALVQIIESRVVSMFAEEDRAPIHTRHSSSITDSDSETTDPNQWCDCSHSEQQEEEGSQSSSDPVADHRSTARLRNISTSCVLNMGETFRALIEILICKMRWDSEQVASEFDITRITSSSWYQVMTEPQRKAYRLIIRFTMLSLADKYPEVSCLLYASCCRGRRHGKRGRQFMSAFRAAVSALIKDFEMFSTDSDNMEQTMALCVDTIHMLYRRGSIKQCIAVRVCARQTQHSSTDAMHQPGALWPLHPNNEHLRGLTQMEARGLTAEEIKAVQANPRRQPLDVQ